MLIYCKYYYDKIKYVPYGTYTTRNSAHDAQQNITKCTLHLDKIFLLLPQWGNLNIAAAQWQESIKSISIRTQLINTQRIGFNFISKMCKVYAKFSLISQELLATTYFTQSKSPTCTSCIQQQSYAFLLPRSNGGKVPSSNDVEQVSINWC